ncbi:MAG: iron-containing alcohol dehydrogenase [candidate division WOR-3 bacterium]
MNSFTFYNPVKIIFGVDKFYSSKEYLKILGKKHLVIIGKGSVKKYGLLEKLVKMIEENGSEYFILEGVKPNPVIEKVKEGIEIARKEKIDSIVTLGGGSVIDTGKAIAAGYFYENDPWDLFSKDIKIDKALPLMVILTVSATGSEFNPISVIQNDNLKHKIRIQSENLFPKFSILDPKLTVTLPKDYTAYASVDIISHVLEGYFTAEEKNTPIQDGFTETIVKTVIDSTYKVLKDPENLNERANIMWAAALGLSGITTAGIGKYKFENHLIEHALSALFDVPHGAGLSIVIPAWMKVNKNKYSEKFFIFGKNVFGLNGSKEYVIEKSIEKIENFFEDIKSPTRLSFYGINEYEDIKKNVIECAPTRNLKIDYDYITKIVDFMK